MKPDEFMRLTPAEVSLLHTGYLRREDMRRDLLASSLTQVICSLGQFKHRPNSQDVYKKLRGPRLLGPGDMPVDAEAMIEKKRRRVDLEARALTMIRSKVRRESTESE